MTKYISKIEKRLAKPDRARVLTFKVKESDKLDAIKAATNLEEWNVIKSFKLEENVLTIFVR